MSDTTVIAVAVATAVGAWWSAPIPLVPAVGVAVVALVRRHPVALVAAAALIAAALGARSWDGLRSVDPGPVRAEVTLVTDPQDALGAVHAEVRHGGHRYEVWARGRAASRLRERAAGETVTVVGRVEPVDVNSWRASRHLAGRLVIDELDGWSRGDPLSQLANATRRTLLDGARVLPEELRPLFGGFVLGDDRGQSATTADDFRGAGLTHLLVVSGQNVAFVLAVAAPLLTRLGLRLRLVGSLAVLGFFALVTRFEPSVLRATVMAALAATASTMGRPVSGARLLGSAVIVLLLVDPLLVHSVGFRLSVAACAGIAALSRPLTDAIPGPRAVAGALGVTLSAQLGVAPVLVPLAGGLPLVTVPANLLAEPVAGALMGWGMTAGIVAGLAPGPVAGVLHLPTTAGLWWVAAVARLAAAAPLGAVGPVGVAILAVGAVAMVLARRRGWRRIAPAIALAAVVIAIAVPSSERGTEPGRMDLTSGAVLWQAPGPDGRWGRVLVLDGRADPARVLAALRRSGVDHLDLLVLRTGAQSTTSVAETVLDRMRVETTWVPVGQRAPRLGEAAAPEPGLSETVGGLVVEVTAVTPRLEVDIEIAGVASTDAARAGAPQP